VNLDFWAAAGYDDLTTSATITQASLQQIGVKVSVQNVNYGQIVNAYQQVSTAPHITDLYHLSSTLDPRQELADYLSTTESFNFYHYSNPRVAQVYQQLGSGGSAGTNEELLEQLAVAIRGDAPAIWGASPQVLVVVPDYLDGYVLPVSNEFYPAYFFQLRVRAH
jgi:ABC-type transport system substrate-binding protein